MDVQTFFEKLKQNPRPVVVDLWAPWCGPCKVVKPTVEKLASEYEERVDVWQINADESQALLRTLKVYGIPTILGYQDGQEVIRYVGVKPKNEMQVLFESLSTGQVPKPAGLSDWDRLLRLAAGTFMLILAWTNHLHWSILMAGGILLFSAVYDRCPIWKAITTQIKKFTHN
ncbi:MAG TPA: thioredoxin domain-containing protein [Anaerolineales bacterium]|nr:thioredoxin domain-containing protein [Anaerolineales bacterium]